MKDWIWNPKVKGSGIITCIPQKGLCPNKCNDCFFQSGRSYLEPLDKNLPHIPSQEMAKGRIVRMNDGNDSNNQRDLVEKVASQFDDYFFNTSIPYQLDKFSAPVVLTINPAKITDNNFHKLKEIPPNLMYVRVRVNMWNLTNVVDLGVDYYTNKETPVILTFMSYYSLQIPELFKDKYIYKKHILNSYWSLKPEILYQILIRYKENSLVYACGIKGNHTCKFCGHCIREYYNTKERLR